MGGTKLIQATWRRRADPLTAAAASYSLTTCIPRFARAFCPTSNRRISLRSTVVQAKNGRILICNTTVFASRSRVGLVIGVIIDEDCASAFDVCLPLHGQQCVLPREELPEILLWPFRHLAVAAGRQERVSLPCLPIFPVCACVNKSERILCSED